MANTPSFWQSTDGQLNQATSWSAAIPGTGIDSIFGNRSGHSAMTDLAIADAATLVTRDDFRADVGAPGSPVTHGTSLFRYIIRHPGHFHLGGQAATSVGQIVVNRGLENPGAYVGLSGTLARVYVVAGTVVVESTGLFSTATGSSWLILNGISAHVTIDKQASSEVLPHIIRMTDGRLINKRDFTSADQVVNISGGEMLQTGIFKANQTVIITGGVLRYEPATDPAGETTNYFVDNGTLDVRGSIFSIPGVVEIGVGGEVLGNAIDKTEPVDVDLRMDYP